MQVGSPTCHCVAGELPRRVPALRGNGHRRCAAGIRPYRSHHPRRPSPVTGIDVEAFAGALRRQPPARRQCARPQTTLAASAGLSRSYRVNLDARAVALFTGGLLVFSTQALAVAPARAVRMLRVLGDAAASDGAHRRRRRIDRRGREARWDWGGFALAQLTLRGRHRPGSGYFRGACRHSRSPRRARAVFPFGVRRGARQRRARLRGGARRLRRRSRRATRSARSRICVPAAGALRHRGRRAATALPPIAGCRWRATRRSRCCSSAR